ncbi:MAG: hypothetical protein J0I34_07180 [Pseudonocardia sp.]|uniref:hypothetical protein n=1 Tax=Actinomycetes TaxID=1760 RepID=UPI00086F1D4E|nr:MULTISPECIES: hypothetical protein [Actinomycetes]MBN9108549.1 hypothetical protein [Pseudonocardia sp.]ODU27429.1 MAG: hypothetical protein ABS80_03370 [Pseudonocardia sp. SCN 72-51]ODV07809.1 MAG: hypothetical protein ABT15_06950 [Pseudonocardia sp. SCN 73-27]
MLGGALLSVHDVVSKQDAVQEKTVAVEQLGQVADPLAQLCAEDPAIRARVGAACGAAQAAVDSPTVQAAKDGSNGTNGADGRGITGTTIGADGHLVVAYSDGTTRDVGKVVGDDGRGIATTTLDGGRLVLVYSDGTRVDLGGVVGPAGRSIVAATTDGGRLVLTLDDGSTLDAGPLPAGPRGQDGQQGGQGPAGPACPDGFQPVETGPVVGTDGIAYSRSITCVDPTSASGG